MLALHGNRDKAGAERAYRAGSTILNTGDSSVMPDIPDWKEILDANLSALDQLKPSDKETLVKALVATVMADEKIAVTEMELLRVVCLVIHVPLPMIGVAQS